MNQKDNGNRKFILVQLPESTEQTDFPTIAEISKERIRRAASKLTEVDRNEKGEDRGFRVFKLKPSNFRRWLELPPDSPSEQIAIELEGHVEHVNPDASQEDLLFEILVKA